MELMRLRIQEVTPLLPTTLLFRVSSSTGHVRQVFAVAKYGCDVGPGSAHYSPSRLVRGPAYKFGLGFKPKNKATRPPKAVDSGELTLEAFLRQAKVVLATHKSKKLALKMPALEPNKHFLPGQREHDIASLATEALLLQDCRRPYIVKCCGQVTGPITANLLELCGPSLYQARHELTPVALSATLRCAACALIFLHGKLVSHGDVKPQNMFLEMHSMRPKEAATKVKLGEFDSAQVLRHRQEKVLTKRGTVYHYSTKARRGFCNPIVDDNWALGLTFKDLAEDVRPVAAKVCQLVQPLLVEEAARGSLEVVLGRLSRR